MTVIYNTLSREKEKFVPVESGKINMYVCGPTVYDVPHIGHARSTYVFDVIRKYFEYKGFNVLFARNVTDVDDKIIKKACDEMASSGEAQTPEGLKSRVNEVAVRYLGEYHRQMAVLGIRPPTVEPKATENIKEMIEFIQGLISKEFAYVNGGDVYFSVEKFKGYGKLSNQNRDQMMHGVRIEIGEKKRHPLDFALWKEAKPGEPSWESPWGAGRPGWHIECSVMSTRLFGDVFDIHGGGLDLIFPHHENEIAQAEALTGKTFANYWMHNGLLTVRGEKMSKSLGNYVALSDFLARYKDPDLLKIAFLGSHYRSPMDYSDDKMEEAARAKERIRIFFDKVGKLEQECKGIDGIGGKKATGVEEDFIGRFNSAMDDDINTPIALSVVFEAVKKGNDVIAENGELFEKAAVIIGLRDFIKTAAGIFGLSLEHAELGEEDIKRIEKMVALRQVSRAKKDYAASDRIRKELAAMGVTVEDTPKGPIWRKN